MANPTPVVKAKPTGVTALDRALSKVEKAITAESELINGIRHEGDVMIVPAHMSLRDAASVLIRADENLEKQEDKIEVFDVHPFDGLYALKRSIDDNFGALLGTTNFGFFGERMPARQLVIDISATEKVSVPVGRAEIPGLPVVLEINPDFDEQYDTGGRLVVKFTYIRKFEALVNRIIETTREYIKQNSIFKGKAITTEFQFMDLSRFNPDRVVYNPVEREQIEGEILTPIVETGLWLELGKSLKRGNLLIGKYGTGKTLTARYIAYVCEKYGWTFINCLPGGDFNRAIRTAKYYEPALVFVEDVDAFTEGERDDKINEVLNTMDGMLNKDSQVMVVMTTNNEHRIQQGMFRPGRLDTIVYMGQLDAETMVNLIIASARDKQGRLMIDGNLDGALIFEAGKDYTPAFIVEAVNKATAYAIHHHRTIDGDIYITQEEIVQSLRALRAQFELMMGEQERDPVTVDTTMRKLFEDEIAPLRKRFGV